MFDSVRLAINEIEIDPAKLSARGWKETTNTILDAEGVPQRDCYYRKPLKNQHPHFLEYYPKRGQLKLETSLPKVLWGENVSMISPGEMEKCFDVMSDRVSSWVGGDIPHVGTWDIRGRVDAVYAWQVGKELPDYLHAFKSVGLSRHISQNVDRDATIYWRNAQRVIRLYDKERETGLKSAHGLLRFEVQANHAKSEFERITGATSTKARDVLTWDNSRAILNNYLSGLGSDLVILDDEKCFKMLAAKFGATRAVRLFGYVQAMRCYSRDELISSGVARNTIWRATRDINAAGASVGSVKSGILRPLRLPVGDFTGSAGEV